LSLITIAIFAIIKKLITKDHRMNAYLLGLPSNVSARKNAIAQRSWLLSAREIVFYKQVTMATRE